MDVMRVVMMRVVVMAKIFKQLSQLGQLGELGRLGQSDLMSAGNTGLNAGSANLNSILQLIFKHFFIFGGIIYIVFAVVVIRQIATMRKTLVTSFSPVIRLLGYLHLALSLAVLLFYITFL